MTRLPNKDSFIKEAMKESREAAVHVVSGFSVILYLQSSSLRLK